MNSPTYFKTESVSTSLLTPPCLWVIKEAEEHPQLVGHPYEGQLSIINGFIPITPPLLNFPPSHQAWDEFVAKLPNYFANGENRSVLAKMPLLDASEESLPSMYLCRAVTVLGHLAHAYIMGNYLAGENPNHTLPACIMNPWKQVSSRLGRPSHGLSYTDLVTYNWRLKDSTVYVPGQSGLTLDNLTLLVEVYATEEERLHFLAFFLTMVAAIPLIQSVIKAQQAVLNKDSMSLAQELITINNTIQAMLEGLLLQDPNPYSPTYSNPIVWARTTATFPGVAGKPGFSGGAAPHIQLLDIFLGRLKFDGLIGQQAIDYRPYIPEIHVNFLTSVAKISVRDYIAQSDDPYLQGVWRELLNTYCGEKSFLETHKRKVYGFMEIAFKGGRKVTNAGFKGTSNQRSWESIDQNLEIARQERLLGTDFCLPLVPVIKKNILSDRTKHLILDISQTGINYKAGERCRLFVENSPELINKTLKALQAEPEHKIHLSIAWQHYLQKRLQQNIASPFPLQEFLVYAKIRPVTRLIAKKLFALISAKEIKEIIDQYREDQYELWDFLQLISQSQYDVRRLWQAEAWQMENLSLILPPEEMRNYSISSSLKTHPNQLHLTVSALNYYTTTHQHKVERKGTGSTYLLEKENIVTGLYLDHQNYFKLPSNYDTPMIMFAGGTGISTFRSFFYEYLKQEESQSHHILFYALQDKNNFYFQKEIEDLVASHKLSCESIFSREAIEANFDQEKKTFTFSPGTKGYIDQLIGRPHNMACIWEHLKSSKAGGKNANFYICGQVPFAKLILDALKHVIKYHLSIELKKPNVEKEAKEMLFSIFAQKRIMMDIFTAQAAKMPAPGSGNFRAYTISEIAKHNNDQYGYWIIIREFVYDVTDFRMIHYGGDKIINAYAGCDATSAYEKVQHHMYSEVESILDMYKIGVVKEPLIPACWEIAFQNHALNYLSLYDLFVSWKKYLFNIIEVENTLLNNYSVAKRALVGSDHTLMNKIKFNLMVDLHNQFISESIPNLVADNLLDLWQQTLGFFGPEQPLNQLKNQLNEFFNSQLGSVLKNSAREIWSATENDNPAQLEVMKKWQTLFESFKSLDLKIIQNLKELILSGINLFESDIARLVKDQKLDLVHHLLSIPKQLEEYAKLIANLIVKDMNELD